MVPAGRFAVMGALCTSCVLACGAVVQAAAPTVEQALSLTPLQKDVDYDRPGPAEAARCTIKAETIQGKTGWVVRDASGQMLRRFLDTNGDNVVDQWCYYSDGLEVYRDIDSNFNGKADQYRWLNTGGTRWGVDADEDGRIEQWKAISAEEASAEVVQAIVKRDPARFAAVLLTSDELKGLGLGETHTKELAAKLGTAVEAFKKVSLEQKGITPAAAGESRVVHFGGNRPGLVPAGTDGSLKDLLVYENVVAMVESGSQHSQVQVGTLVKAGDLWRVIDSPQVLSDGGSEHIAAGFFFRGHAALRPDASAGGMGDAARLQELLGRLEKLDRQPAGGSAEQQARQHSERADLLEEIIDAAQGDDRMQWVRNLADTVSAAAQTGSYPDGVKRLLTLHEELAKAGGDQDLAGYVKFRYLTAEYGSSLQVPNPDFAKIQSRWLESLEQYVKDYPQSGDAAEAMLQLAISKEFAGQEESATEWYSRIVTTFPKTAAAEKALGAKTRLQSVGKVLTLKGPGVQGGVVDLSAPAFRGKAVLIHYWATWCEPCKTDLAMIKEMQAKYGNRGLAIVGISLDSRKEELVEYLQRNRLAWPQIYEEGGLDSRLANSLGILTLPTMLLLDKQGRVVNRNIHVTELDKEIGALLR